MKQFFLGRCKSVRYVFKGMWLLLRTEHAIQAQLLIFLPFLLLGLCVGLTPGEWALQFFCLALILATESLNTAIEKLCDFVHPQHHPGIGFIKDVAAGASGFAVLLSMVVALFIYLPHIF